MAKLISGWEELSKVMGDGNYKLDITPENGNGWIVDKQTGITKEYLSTHTFYGSEHIHSSKLLQKYGFDVELANWDGEKK